MTKDDIIRMAREAGFLIDTHAQKYQPNCILSTHGLIDDNLQRFANLAVAAEREECARLCQEIMQEHNPFDRQAGVARRCLDDIRARRLT